MGEYDTRRTRPAARDDASGGRTRTRGNGHVVRPPFALLAVSPVLMLLSVSSLLVFGTTTRGFVIAFVGATLATITAVVATFEDQRRMTNPSYSMVDSFRLLCVLAYVSSLVLALVYIVMVAYRVAS